MATFGEWFVKLLAKLVLRQKWNADNMSHGQGKPQNGQGNVREKSGNFVRAHGWTPCTFLNENLLILIKISLKFVHKGPIFIVHTL